MVIDNDKGKIMRRMQDEGKIMRQEKEMKQGNGNGGGERAIMKQQKGNRE